jgi:hypothetical protein
VKRRPTGRDPGKHCSSPSPPSTPCVQLSICSSIARTSIRLQRCLFYVYLQSVGARCTSYCFKQLLVSTGSTDSDVEYVNHLGARGHCPFALAGAQRQMPMTRRTCIAIRPCTLWSFLTNVLYTYYPYPRVAPLPLHRRRVAIRHCLPSSASL